MTTFSRKVNSVVSVPVNTRYLNWFLQSKCAPDVLRYFQGTNTTKEITESTAAFFHAVKQLPGGMKSCGREDVLCLIPGDGSVPRTGALVIHHTRWQVVSIDPAVSLKNRPKRLVPVPDNAEDFILCYNPSNINTVVVLGVHSHAPMGIFLERLRGKLHPDVEVVVVNIPCCAHHKITWPPLVYRKNDAGIFSRKNTVEVYSTTKKGES